MWLVTVSYMTCTRKPIQKYVYITCISIILIYRLVLLNKAMISTRWSKLTCNHYYSRTFLSSLSVFLCSVILSLTHLPLAFLAFCEFENQIQTIFMIVKLIKPVHLFIYGFFKLENQNVCIESKKNLFFVFYINFDNFAQKRVKMAKIHFYTLFKSQK